MELMQSSWRLALNTLAGKKGRTALMISAVGLAASLVVAVSCAIASVQASMEQGIVKILGRADARPELKIIDVFICKLRKKLSEATGGENYIETVWGRGYVLRDPASSEAKRRLAVGA
jgi:hypothetical protein